MKSLFRISPNYKVWEKKINLHIDAEHKYSMPGVNCTMCGTRWGNIGTAYPAIDLSPLISSVPFSDYLDGWPLDLQEFESLRQATLPFMNGSSILPPGTQFGPLIGSPEGFYGHFAWIGLWTLLIQEETMLRMEAHGVKGLVGVYPSWERSSPSAKGLLELYAEPCLDIYPRSVDLADIRRCPGCGRLAIKWSDPLVVYSVIPEHLDIFRGKDMSSSLFVSGNFVDVANTLGLNCILFEEIHHIDA